MKYPLILTFRKFRKTVSSVLIGTFFVTLIIPWYTAWAITGTFTATQTVANVTTGTNDQTATTLTSVDNVVAVSEVKATRTLSVWTLPLNAQTITIGTCSVTFTTTAGDTIDDTDCDSGAVIDTNIGVGDQDRSTDEIATVLRSLSNISDTGHGALAITGSASEAIFTTFATESSATEITFTDGTGGNITSTSSTTGVIPVTAIAQINTITIANPEIGDIFTATLPGSVTASFTATTTSTTDVASGLNTAIQASAGYGAQAFTSGSSGAVVTLTAKVAGTGFTQTSGTTNRAAVAQVVTFTPASLTFGETFRGTLNGTAYNYTLDSTPTVQEVVEGLQPLMDGAAAITCTEDNTLVSCTADAAGTGFTYAGTVVDITAPTVTIVMANTALKVGETSPVTFTFSEAVTSFDATDVTVPNGAIGTVSVTGDPLIYTGTFTPTASVEDTSNIVTVGTSWSDIELNAPAGSSTSANYQIDTLRPTVGIVMADTALKVGETSLVTFTFSEAVSGFTNADITAIENGTLTSVVDGGAGTVYTATFTPTASVEDTTNIITVDKTGVLDGAGNAGSGSTSTSNYTIDTLSPTVSIIMADTDLKVGETSLVTFTFSESVSGFANADVTTIANGTLSTIAGSGTTYTATFTPTASVEDATNIITVDKTGVSDAAGNAGVGSTNTANYTIDTTRPTVAITLSDSALKVGETSTITFTFSEAPTWFTAADVTVENGTIGATSASSSTVYTALFTPTASLNLDATNIVTVGTVWTDAAGNAPSGSSTSANYEVDTLAPTTQNTSFATGVDKQWGATVTIVSGGETGLGAVWFAPNGTSSFSAGATMTTASGTATSILAPLTAGAYKLYVIDAAGNISSASTAILTVDNTGPAMSAISSSILFPPGTTILWTTSEWGSTRVEYGLTDSYGSFTTLDSTLTTSHSVTISGLAQVTEYHYRVISVDAAGNSTTSADNTVTTSGVGSGGGGGGAYLYIPSAPSLTPSTPPTTAAPLPPTIQTPKNNITVNSAPENITPASFKNIQKHINSLKYLSIPQMVTTQLVSRR